MKNVFIYWNSKDKIPDLNHFFHTKIKGFWSCKLSDVEFMGCECCSFAKMKFLVSDAQKYNRLTEYKLFFEPINHVANFIFL